MKRYTAPTRGKKFGAFVFATLAVFVSLVAVNTAIEGYHAHHWLMVAGGVAGVGLGTVGVVTAVSYAYRQDRR